MKKILLVLIVVCLFFWAGCPVVKAAETQIAPESETINGSFDLQNLFLLPDFGFKEQLTRWVNGWCKAQAVANQETQITPDYPNPVIQNPFPDSATPRTDKIAPANPAPPTPSYPDAAIGK